MKELEKRGYREFIRRLEGGVRYCRVMTEEDRADSAIGRGWKGTFKAETRKEAEDGLRKRSYDWEWIKAKSSDGVEEEDEWLLKEITPVLDAIRVNANGEKVFFNQIVAAWNGWRDKYNSPKDCVRFADGTPLDEDVMKVASDLLDECSVAFRWEKGDILLIDNTSVMHARRSFKGKRKVLASLAK